MPPNANVPAPDFVNPPPPVIAPANVVVLAATENILLVPVKAIALARLNAVEKLICAVLLEAELSNWILPLVLTRLPIVVKSRVAVVLAAGVKRIFPPAKGPNPPVTDEANVPLVTVVAPVYVFTPPRVHVPVPDLLRAPVVVPIIPLSVPEPVPVKFKLKVFPDTAPPNVTPPDPDASNVPPLPVSVIARAVVSPAPVYCKVPVAPIEIAGVVLPVPIELLVPAFASLTTLNIPLFIVVAPL